MTQNIIQKTEITFKFWTDDNFDSDEYMETMIFNFEKEFKGYEHEISFRWDYCGNNIYALSISEKSTIDFYKSHSYYEPDEWTDPEVVDEDTFVNMLNDICPCGIENIFTIEKIDSEMVGDDEWYY